MKHEKQLRSQSTFSKPLMDCLVCKKTHRNWGWYKKTFIPILSLGKNKGVPALIMICKRCYKDYRFVRG